MVMALDRDGAPTPVFSDLPHAIRRIVQDPFFRDRPWHEVARDILVLPDGRIVVVGGEAPRE